MSYAEQFSQPWHCSYFGLDISLLWGGYPVHCGIFSNIPDLFPLEVSSNLLQRQPKISPHTVRYSREAKPWPDCELVYWQHIPKIVEAKRMESIFHLEESDKAMFASSFEIHSFNKILSTYQMQSARLCIKVNSSFLNGREWYTWNRIICSGNCQVFDICELWQ